MITIGANLGRLVELFGNRKHFPRRRCPPRVKALAVRMYAEGLSLTRASEVLGELGFRASHEAIRRWFHAAGELLLSAVKRRRDFVAADETVV